MRGDAAPRIRELLAYDPNTGVFTWRADRRPGIKAGTVAGHVNEGYRLIKVDGVMHRAHRLAWLYVHGEWPSGRLDHENGDGTDNRIANLRRASHSQNMANTKLRRDSTSGFKGVSFSADTGKWTAYVNKDRKRHYLGLFETAEAAHEAYTAEAQRLHGEFARTS